MKRKLGAKTLLYPMPAVLIGSIVEEKPNFMTAAWCGIAAQNPPSIAVAIQKSRHTLKGIEEKACFSVNVPNSSLVKKVDFCGTHSGAKYDKSGVFKVFFGELKDAPMVEECPVNLECRLVKSVDIGSHVLIIGEIVETFVDEACLKEGKPDPKKIDPLIYATGVRKYAVLGDYIADAFSIGKENKDE